MADNRRKDILNKLSNNTSAMSARFLAKEFGVSRQIIVGDIALLRAQGHPIVATSKGYIMYSQDTRYQAKIAVDHTQAQTEEELRLIVDLGAYVVDVTVFHPIYGEISGQLDIRTHQDIDQFLNEVENKETELLSTLTRGIHLHTISCESQAHYEQVIKALQEKHFLYQDDPKVS